MGFAIFLAIFASFLIGYMLYGNNSPQMLSVLIGSFILSLEYVAGIAVILCGVPIFKECAEGLKEFDIKADFKLLFISSKL